MLKAPPLLPIALSLGLTVTACATAPEPASGYLSSYEGLTPRTDTLRASVLQRRDEALAQTIEDLHIERAELSPDAAQLLTPEDRALVLGEMDRQVCYELSQRFTLVDTPSPGIARVRLAATRISPTHQVGSVAAAVASKFIPGPIGFRAPGSTGGLAAEAELLAPDGRQVAALIFARNATVVGTDNPSLSRVGDAHQLARVFGDMVADTFAPEDRKARPVADPDPCARYGPRFRPEGLAVRFVTGLYQPEVSGGRAQPDPAPATPPVSAPVSAPVTAPVTPPVIED